MDSPRLSRRLLRSALSALTLALVTIALVGGGGHERSPALSDTAASAAMTFDEEFDGSRRLGGQRRQMADRDR